MKHTNHNDPFDNDQSDESFWDFIWETDWPVVCAAAAIILWAVVLLIVIS